MMYKLQDLIDLNHFQNLLDRLNGIYAFPSAIIDNDGNILAATAWQDICTRFHRQNKECERECIKSDQYIVDHLHEANPTVSYLCPHGLLDNATPIIIEGVHYANFFTGQFFLEPPDMQFFRAQAEKYGFEEDAYLEAVRKVPIWSREQLDSYLFVIKGLIAVIAESGLKRLKEIEMQKGIVASEKHYKTILHTAMDGFWVVDLNGHLLEVNEAYCLMSGYSQQELLNMSIHELEDNESEAETKVHIENLLLRGKDRFETRHRRKDGKVIDVEISTQIGVSEPVRIIAFIRDITELKRAGKALKKAEARVKEGLDNLLEGCQILGFDWRYLYINESAARQGHKAREEFLDRRIMDVLPGIENTDLFVSLKICMEQREKQHLQNEFTYSDGQKSWFDLSIQPVEDGIFILSIDITERKMAETALLQAQKARQETEALLNAMIANISDVIGILDQDAIIRYKSPNIEKLFGWKPDDLIGTNGWDTVHPDDLERIQAEFVSLLQKPGDTKKVEYRYKCKDGSYCYIELQAINLIEDASIKGILMNYHDTTTRRQALQELRESHELLEGLAHLVPGVIYQYRLYPDGRSAFPYSSPGMNDIYEVTPEEVCSDATPVFGRLHPDDFDRVVAVIQESAEKLQTFYCEFRVNLPRQGLRWRWSQAHPQRLEDGSILWHGIILDATDRKNDEAELNRRKQLVETIFESVPIGLAMHETDSGNVLVVNEAFQAAYKIPRELCGTVSDFFQYVYSERMDLGQKILEGVLSGDPNRMKWDGIPIIDKKSGKTSFISAMNIPVSGQNLMISVVQDITTRMQAEIALVESEKRFQSAFKFAPIGIALVSTTGSFLRVNRVYCEMLGYAENELMAVDFPEITHPDDKELSLAKAHQLLSGKINSFQMEKRYVCKSGTVIWVLLSVSLVRNEQNQPLYFVSQVQDITARIQSEETQRKLEGQLRQAQKMEAVGRLAGGVAHDFNNMLAVILGNVELAMDQVGSASQFHTELKEIKTAAQRSADLTRQLLAFARKQTVTPKVLNLNKTVESMLKMLSRLIGEDIALSWNPGRELGRIKMDPSQIDQILANLCVNARDAILNCGKITIETENAVFNESDCADRIGFFPGEYVVLAVSDNGVGMDNETQQQIFEPFFTSKKMGQGTGLGLATVYGIVKQNNGFITVYSELGEGTTFKIYLPQYSGKGSGTSELELAPALDATMRGSETILLVEDEPSILVLAQKMLQKLGYKVLPSNSPSEAIRMAHEYSGDIHMLMTDVVMPEMNGRELAKNLLMHNPKIKRLFMSGYTANVIAHHGVLDEGVHFIQKPFTMRELATKVRELMEQED